MQDKMKAAPSGAALLFYVTKSVVPGLGKADSLVGTNISASAALSAGIRVDGVDVTLGDCSYRAFVNTCTASDTVVTNYVSHNLVSLIRL